VSLENIGLIELAKTIKEAENNSVEIWCAKTLLNNPHQEF